MVTVPILGTDVHPKDRCLSQFYYISIWGSEFESEPNGKFLHSTVIRVRVRCGDLNQPSIFRASLDHFDCCEWDPIFINVDFYHPQKFWAR